MFAMQVCLRRAHVSMAPLPRDQLNAKDADMEQVLFLYYITTKVLVKCRIDISGWTRNRRIRRYNKQKRIGYLWIKKSLTEKIAIICFELSVCGQWLSAFMMRGQQYFPKKSEHIKNKEDNYEKLINLWTSWVSLEKVLNWEKVVNLISVRRTAFTIKFLVLGTLIRKPTGKWDQAVDHKVDI